MRAWMYIPILIAFLPCSARADDLVGCAGCDHTMERAGNPQRVACYARPSRTAKYALGYVGGGCLGIFHKAEGRCPQDGIFGWDYDCGFRPGRVFLGWCHCNRNQKSGTYKPDGPPVPDIFSVHPIKEALGKDKCQGGKH